jgi:hypothetical protein
LKEVFADARFYISTSSYHHDDNTSGNSSTSYWPRASSVAAVVGSLATMRSWSSSNNRSGHNGSSNGLADARDDKQDKFAPWRGGGGANGNQPRLTAGNSSANDSGSKNCLSNAGGNGGHREYSNQQHQQQRQHCDLSEKIV